MAEAPFEVSKAHRWFAVELNNLTWDLLEAKDRTQEQTEQMIDAAHGASYHWQQVGTIVNTLRAQCLLATVYANAGYADAALKHARKCLECSDAAGEQKTPFDQATAFGCAALAYRCAGQTDKAEEMQQKAQNIVSTFRDAEDKAVFERFYGV